MGKGGRGKGYDGGKGKGKDEPPPTTANHYFGAAADEDPEEKERVKQEMKLKKKLRELEALEKRRDAGEKLESLQLKKLETKAGIEEELRQLGPPKPKPKQAVDLDDDYEDKVEDHDPPDIDLGGLQDELAALEEAKADLEELSRKPEKNKGKGKDKGGKGGKSSGQPKQVVAPTISMRQQQAQAAAGKGWGGRGPAPAAAAPKRNEAVERMFIPQGDEEGVQLEMFQNDLELWALKFECSSKIEGKEVVARFNDPDINVAEAMGELREIMKFNFPGAYK